MHIHTHTYTYFRIYIYMCVCVIKSDRHFISAYSAFDPFKSQYESFDFWMEWRCRMILKHFIPFKKSNDSYEDLNGSKTIGRCEVAVLFNQACLKENMQSIYLSMYFAGVSSWCNCESDELQNRSTRVRTPVALLRSLSGKYPWERYEPPYSPSIYG